MCGIENNSKPVQNSHLPDNTIVKHDLRGTRATLKVSEGLLWGEEVVVLVLEVIQLQIACSIHPEQFISCRPKQTSQEYGKGAKRTNMKTGKEHVTKST